MNVNPLTTRETAQMGVDRRGRRIAAGLTALASWGSGTRGWNG
ncbi:hypothetical protein SAMN00790413_02721 [Deinococcus hopiensis KR-140]|uniref:Uncharacterized protein n=1 Tax=Deinococcus hopiensis KR-140 TaxID=695939 RepID=A0A1W1VP59_9DEIO|nr:hypothetical protein SAMN00790413_02721 [Deinococcus hopiensis KR-140]